MKLATLNNGTRDGTLIIVNRQLSHYKTVPDIAPTLQQALDDWRNIAPQLHQISAKLNQGEIAPTGCFNPQDCLSPLPRAYQWADGSAYVNHVELVRKARGASLPPKFWTDPLVYQGGSDHFLAPTEPIIVSDIQYGVDFEAEVAIVTDDVPMSISAQEALAHIKLLMLVNDVSFRHLIPAELEKGFGFFQSKPASSFSPVAITPDELGPAWHEGKVHLPLISTFNGQLFGKPNAGIDMTFSFAHLIAHAAKTRRLTAGSIIGSGTVSNLDRSQGSSCIAEKRMLELLETGAITTSFMQYGDTIRIEMNNAEGESIFGAIEQTVQPQ